MQRSLRSPHLFNGLVLPTLMAEAIVALTATLGRHVLCVVDDLQPSRARQHDLGRTAAGR